MSADPQLVAAYRATTYRVAAPGGAIELRIDAVSAPLDALLAGYGATCWAYLAAVNPGSQPLAAAANAVRHAALAAVLREAGHSMVAGEAIADAGDWPVEPGFLVPGLGRAAAVELAARFGQNALLWGRCGGPVSLVWVGEVT